MPRKPTAKRKPKADLDKLRASWAKDKAKDDASPDGPYHPLYITPAQEPAIKLLRSQILNIAELLEVGGVDSDLRKLANPPREAAVTMWNELQPRRHAVSGEWIPFPDADNPKVVTRRKIMRGIIDAVSPLCSRVANFDATKTPGVVRNLRKLAALLNEELHPNNRARSEPVENAPATAMSPGTPEPHVAPDRFPADHYNTTYGIPASRLESARRDGRLAPPTYSKKIAGRWHYNDAEVRNLWPEDFLDN
jgi:hypothetical protein